MRQSPTIFTIKPSEIKKYQWFEVKIVPDKRDEFLDNLDQSAGQVNLCEMGS